MQQEMAMRQNAINSFFLKNDRDQADGVASSSKPATTVRGDCVCVMRIRVRACVCVYETRSRFLYQFNYKAFMESNWGPSVKVRVCLCAVCAYFFRDSSFASEAF